MNEIELENARRQEVTRLNSIAANRIELEKTYGKVWDTSELSNDFDVRGFMAPYVVVFRKSDSVKGSLSFQHSPRFYFDFIED